MSRDVMRSCRFCKKGTLDRHLVKYGVRHYAHDHCLLAQLGAPAFERLSLHALQNFPALTASRFGFLAVLEEAIDRKRNPHKYEPTRRKELVEGLTWIATTASINWERREYEMPDHLERKIKRGLEWLNREIRTLQHTDTPQTDFVIEHGDAHAKT